MARKVSPLQRAVLTDIIREYDAAVLREAALWGAASAASVASNGVDPALILQSRKAPYRTLHALAGARAVTLVSEPKVFGERLRKRAWGQWIGGVVVDRYVAHRVTPTAEGRAVAREGTQAVRVAVPARFAGHAPAIRDALQARYPVAAVEVALSAGNLSVEASGFSDNAAQQATARALAERECSVPKALVDVDGDLQVWGLGDNEQAARADAVAAGFVAARGRIVDATRAALALHHGTAPPVVGLTRYGRNAARPLEGSWYVASVGWWDAYDLARREGLPEARAKVRADESESQALKCLEAAEHARELRRRP